MTNRILEALTPQQQNQLALFSAKRRLEDSFTNKSTLLNLDSISAEIRLYLMDYFLLSDDLKSTLQEEYRRCYHDYSFLVFPVHKAFELFLKGLLLNVLNVRVSKQPGETIGYILNLDATQKIKLIDDWVGKLPWGKAIGKEIDKNEWIVRLDSLKEQWDDNRNPLTHPEFGPVPTYLEADQTAIAILTKIRASMDVFNKQYFEPFNKWLEENKETIMKMLEEKSHAS